MIPFKSLAMKGISEEVLCARFFGFASNDAVLWWADIEEEPHCCVERSTPSWPPFTASFRAELLHLIEFLKRKTWNYITHSNFIPSNIIVNTVVIFLRTELDQLSLINFILTTVINIPTGFRGYRTTPFLIFINTLRHDSWSIQLTTYLIITSSDVDLNEDLLVNITSLSAAENVTWCQLTLLEGVSANPAICHLWVSSC